jgi:hypothetical protein
MDYKAFVIPSGQIPVRLTACVVFGKMIIQPSYVYNKHKGYLLDANANSIGLSRSEGSIKCLANIPHRHLASVDRVQGQT